MKCAVDNCPFEVVRTESGAWAHVETHGAVTGHIAVPRKEPKLIGPEMRQAVKDALLRTRLAEYRDSQQGIVDQLEQLIIVVEAAGGDATALRDGIAFYKPVVEDLNNLLTGKELKPFIVTGVIPEEGLSGE